MSDTPDWLDQLNPWEYTDGEPLSGMQSDPHGEPDE